MPCMCVCADGCRNALQADVFAFAMVMLEVFKRVVTSVVVAGPTMNPRVAEMYAIKVRASRPVSCMCLYLHDTVHTWNL